MRDHDSSSKAVSTKKITANRRNALRSTGPTTAQGKRVVSMNALKHGLLAELVVIDDGDGKENAAAYQQLLSSLVDDLRPAGALEELLVQEIANCYWRLRRVLRHEVGLIREDLDDCTWNTIREITREQNDPESEHRMFEGFREAFETLTRDLAGDADLTCHMVETIRTKLSPRYDEYIPHVLSYLDLWQRSKRLIPGEVTASISPAELRAERKKALEEAFTQVVVFKVSDRIEKQAMIHKVSAKRSSLHIPSPDKVANLVRYESAIHRQLYRAMDQLERRQRLRRGEFVPAPVKINLESGR